MKKVFPDKQLNYVLRMYLPHWNYDKILADIIRFCKETGTEHILLFTDAQHMVWNQLTLEEARKEVGNIARAVKDLAEHGIGVGINSSYNMVMSRFDHTEHNPQYQHWTTLADGTCEKRSPCLLDPALKPFLKEFYGLLAASGAEYIYIDDDHRYICDGRNNTWGCMCELHLREFSKISGREWTREELQHGIFNDPEVRRKWITFLREGLEDLAEWIGKAVHDVNPEMPVGVMVPSLHSTTLYAYDLPKMARKFQPEGPLIMRPCIGAYSDRYRVWVIAGFFYMEQIGHLMGSDVQYTLEIETTPFTRFSSSMKNIRLHIAQGIINGMNNPAISACGYVGNSPYFEPEIAKMLKRERPFFETLIKIAPKPGSRKGIGAKYHKNSAYDTPETPPLVSDYFHPAFAVQDALTNSGFCTTFEKSPVTILAGDSVYSFPEEEIRKDLSGNLILDAAAAKGLIKRGFGEFIGAEISDMDTHFGAEYYTDETFCGAYTGLYQPLQDVPLEDVMKISAISPGAKAISWITDHNKKNVAPAMVLFENKLGGKIAVMTYRIGPGTIDLPHLICYQKQAMLRNILNWMDPRALPFYVEDPSCFYVQYFDDGETVFAGFCNASYDVSNEATLYFEDPELDMDHAVYLKEDGTLQPLAGIIERTDEKKWKIRKQFFTFHLTVLQIPKKKG